MSVKRLKVLSSEVVLTEERDAYNTLRNKFLRLSKEARVKTLENYDKEVKSYSDLRMSAQYMLDRIFKEYLQVGAIQLISYGIYDVDEEVLREEYSKDFEIGYKNVIQNIIKEINSIDSNLAQSKSDRKDMVADAGSTFETLGFYRQTGDVGKDLSNVFEAETETMAMNAIMAGGAAILSAGMGAVEKKAAESEKAGVFSRTSTKNSLVSAMENDVYQMHKTIARIANERIKQFFVYPQKEELIKIEPEVRNAIAGNFAHDEKNPDLELNQIIKILTINPYETRIYSYIMKKYNGLTDDLNDTVSYLNIDKQDLADSYLRSIYNIKECTTYENVLAFEDNIKQEMKSFDVTDCKYLSEVTDYKNLLFTKRKTFNSFVYSTIEDRDKAEKQFMSFFDEPVADMDMDDLVEKYFETLPSSIYQKNREDLQLLIMGQLSGYIDKVQNSAIIEPYIITAEQKKKEYGIESMTLLDALLKRKKKLYRKESVMMAVDNVKGTFKNFGKNFKDKVSFEKKPVIEANEPIGISDNIEKANYKICPQCGTNLKEEAKFCKNCGYKF